ncbi:MAG: LysR family transcriptional regulator [Chloroflexi bacterium]|nr:LysR family transcriptional regulator [Chloroflexota bacterium]
MNGPIDTRLLQTFQTVARTLNFTRAAEELDYAQSSITAQIQVLEKSLGVKLFDRLGKRIILTESGKKLLEYADKILRLSDEVYLAIAHPDEPVGKLYISTPETLSAYRLPPLLREFRQQFPHVQIVLQSIPDEKVVDRVAMGEIDIAIVLSELKQESSDIQVKLLVKEPLLLVAPPDHILAHLPMIPADLLRHASFLLTEANCTYRTLFEQQLAGIGIHPTTLMEFNSVEAIKQCVMADMGIAFLPEIAVWHELETGKLVTLNWLESKFHLYTQLLWHGARWISPAMAAFINLSEHILTPTPENFSV